MFGSREEWKLRECNTQPFSQGFTAGEWDLLHT